MQSEDVHSEQITPTLVKSAGGALRAHRRYQQSCLGRAAAKAAPASVGPSETPIRAVAEQPNVDPADNFVVSMVTLLTETLTMMAQGTPGTPEHEHIIWEQAQRAAAPALLQARYERWACFFCAVGCPMWLFGCVIRGRAVDESLQPPLPARAAVFGDVMLTVGAVGSCIGTMLLPMAISDIDMWISRTKNKITAFLGAAFGGVLMALFRPIIFCGLPWTLVMYYIITREKELINRVHNVVTGYLLYSEILICALAAYSIGNGLEHLNVAVIALQQSSSLPVPIAWFGSAAVQFAWCAVAHHQHHVWWLQAAESVKAKNAAIKEGSLFFATCASCFKRDQSYIQCRLVNHHIGLDWQHNTLRLTYWDFSRVFWRIWSGWWLALAICYVVDGCFPPANKPYLHGPYGLDLASVVTGVVVLLLCVPMYRDIDRVLEAIRSVFVRTAATATFKPSSGWVRAYEHEQYMIKRKRARELEGTLEVVGNILQQEEASNATTETRGAASVMAQREIERRDMLQHDKKDKKDKKERNGRTESTQADAESAEEERHANALLIDSILGELEAELAVAKEDKEAVEAEEPEEAKEGGKVAQGAEMVRKEEEKEEGGGGGEVVEEGGGRGEASGAATDEAHINGHEHDGEAGPSIGQGAHAVGVDTEEDETESQAGGAVQDPQQYAEQEEDRLVRELEEEQSRSAEEERQTEQAEQALMQELEALPTIPKAPVEEQEADGVQSSEEALLGDLAQQAADEADARMRELEAGLQATMEQEYQQHMNNLQLRRAFDMTSFAPTGAAARIDSLAVKFKVGKTNTAANKVVPLVGGAAPCTAPGD
jgi:flagellar biosynthesis GTPase FlhF